MQLRVDITWEVTVSVFSSGLFQVTLIIDGCYAGGGFNSGVYNRRISMSNRDRLCLSKAQALEAATVAILSRASAVATPNRAEEAIKLLTVCNNESRQNTCLS